MIAQALTVSESDERCSVSENLKMNKPPKNDMSISRYDITSAVMI